MRLILPGNIPVAAENLEALLRIGSPWMLRADHEALALVTNDSTDPCIVWASPKLTTYRAIWNNASALGFVEPTTEWGERVAIDHVFPKSWAHVPGANLKYVRLFPVWAEINSSAGGGREKHARPPIIVRNQGLVFAEELQVLKILGHPVAKVSDPVKIFGAKRQGKR